MGCQVSRSEEPQKPLRQPQRAPLLVIHLPNNNTQVNSKSHVAHMAKPWTARDTKWLKGMTVSPPHKG